MHHCLQKLSCRDRRWHKENIKSDTGSLFKEKIKATIVYPYVDPKIHRR
ncbi:MAG: hypothetical protein UX65_C0005G0041 [Parcubacteria group bacterium GW2011_GWB1_46_8]|nr:MAG: hypothetical protein UX61_C0001G0020 [Parcubacteria group bacterium GW2011_GWA2_46_7]KKU46335.1 MAG: hypothetical protein UX65_C0005G0041 [Parcubacteria group bacterium GW2011_GWB1_46_8]